MEVVTHNQHVANRQFDEAKLAIISRGKYRIF